MAVLTILIYGDIIIMYKYDELCNYRCFFDTITRSASKEIKKIKKLQQKCDIL